jgi:hypothetical protein
MVITMENYGFLQMRITKKRPIVIRLEVVQEASLTRGFDSLKQIFRMAGKQTHPTVMQDHLPAARP